MIVRKANKDDDLKKIAELIYKTDPYIYPYWFENLDNCLEELPPLLLEDKFFFNIDHIFVSIVEEKIVGIVCIIEKATDLSYDYTELKKKNERYLYTIENYIEKLIDEVKDVDFAYISNVCVDEAFRGRGVGKTMLDDVMQIFTEKMYRHFVLDVVADNIGAVKMYNNLSFEQFTKMFSGFSDPDVRKPDVYSMEYKI